MRYTIRQVNKPANKKYTVIIPAAGLGKRMRSYGPKSLIKIKDDTTILDNQIRHIKSNLKRQEIIVVAGFKYDKIKEKYSAKNLKIIENPLYDNTNVASSIALGLEHTSSNNIVILYGDLIFNSYALKAPFGRESMIITDKYGLMDKDEVGSVIVNNKVQNMMYDLPNKWAHILYITGNELSALRMLCKNTNYHNHFGFELINQIISEGGSFSSYSPKRMKIIDIDTSKDLEQVSKIL